MKAIKTFVIGFLTCACIFLIMGQTKGEDYMQNLLGEDYIEQMKNSAKQIQDAMPPVGRYQISISNHLNKGVFETIIDTKTGEIFKREKVKFNQ